MQRILYSLGFSLVELMIVISIISILSIIAIPSYQTYVKRARFSEVISITNLFKTAVSIALQQGNALTELTNGAHGIPPEPKETKNLATLKVENGMITATGTELVDNATYILEPNEDGSRWNITGTCIEAGLCHA
ncbi:MAG: prepilin-type N-terminal cleavage/methylation domain-containing protein [Gammaproteobacteria bacterium]|nr:prepilin-type N-terminal cleavage/methylation domain-containing protein [Gammaproteobacteria bacterium]